MNFVRSCQIIHGSKFKNFLLVKACSIYFIFCYRVISRSIRYMKIVTQGMETVNLYWSLKWWPVQSPTFTTKKPKKQQVFFRKKAVWLIVIRLKLLDTIREKTHTVFRVCFSALASHREWWKFINTNRWSTRCSTKVTTLKTASSYISVDTWRNKETANLSASGPSRKKNLMISRKLSVQQKPTSASEVYAWAKIDGKQILIPSITFNLINTSTKQPSQAKWVVVTVPFSKKDNVWDKFFQKAPRATKF